MNHVCKEIGAFTQLRLLERVEGISGPKWSDIASCPCAVFSCLLKNKYTSATLLELFITAVRVGIILAGLRHRSEAYSYYPMIVMSYEYQLQVPTKKSRASR